MASSYLEPIQRELDSNGIPLSGAKLRFYDNLTTTPRTVYSDAALSVPIAQPILSNAEGWYPRVFVQQGAYTRTRHTPDDVLIDSEDDIDPGLSSGAGALGIAVGGTGATTAAGARSNLGVPSTAVTDGLDTRVTDLETIIDAPPIEVATVTAYAATLALNFTSNWSQQITLTGPLLLSAPTGTNGQPFRVVLIQDGTGGRSVTLASDYKTQGGSILFSRTAGAVDIFEGVVRGGEFHIISVKTQDLVSGAGPDALIEERQAAGVSGGTPTVGVDVTRVLNTKTFDRLSAVSLSANQITLSLPGTYYFDWEAPGYGVQNHQSWLFDITGAAVVDRGTSEYTGTSGSAVITTWSRGSAYHTITAPNVYSIRQRFGNAPVNGLGLAGSYGQEIYTRVKIWKVA